jgi:hypothetical protein
MRSYPGVILGFRSSCILFGIFLCVKNLIGCIICSGSCSALLISASNSSFCGSSFGLNAFSKCPEKEFVFSLSLQTQLWSFSLIAGMCFIGCFNISVAFRNEYSALAGVVKL